MNLVLFVHFEALVQTQVVCGNFHGLETNTYFPVNGVDQAHSTGVQPYTNFSFCEEVPGMG